MTQEDQIFKKHYDYYKNVGIETIKQQAGQVEQVSSDYQGRVIYELLQNAFDKADKDILVKVVGNTLIVANDGSKFTYIADFDYDKGTSIKRGDFQSLCSISTSSKNVNSSIGNKGVGFKSAFSIAEQGYVNIYTRGEILTGNEVVPEIISFRIYDTFKDVDNIPSAFDDDIKSNIKEKIEFVQKERLDRGVPGYYFPLHITNENDDIIELFKKYVTVVEIPLSDKESVKSLFDEIKKIHFQFIQIKYPADFNIQFIFDEDINTKSIYKDSELLFVAEVNNDIIKSLALDAGISIENPRVAIFIKDKPDGLLYNYLPTKIDSPFKYVDFQADFHTTVDRKSINFDGKIGAYNKALFRACLELYFIVLNSHLEAEDRIHLVLQYIDESKVEHDLTRFDWNLLELGNSFSVFHDVRNILKISNLNNYYYSYDIATSLLGKLASLYFKQTRGKDQHVQFFDSTSKFIYCFGRDDGQKWEWLEFFKDDLAKKLKALNAGVIPDISLSESTELLYRKSSDLPLELPDFLGINITDFEIKDEYFRKALNIKEFIDYNEILKYYKQCSFIGEFALDRLTEEEQKELIKSLYRLFEAKNEQSYLSTHRFTKASNSELRKNNSVLNQAYFNISTIFLKTKSGKYKPAQLCLIDELDSEFLISIIETEKKDDFLGFLGVSFDVDSIFADSRIYDKLNEGIDFIPGLIDRKEFNEDISDLLIKNIFIISRKGDKKHPALLNNNDYKFLDNISKQTIKLELDNLLVKNYDFFPKEYKEILKARIEENISLKDDIVRFYQSIFHLFEKENQYLIIENNVLKWTTKIEFVILNSKQDYDLCVQIENKKVLCYYIGHNLPERLSHLVIKPVKGEIMVTNALANKELKLQIEEKIIYILISISHSKNSETNYLDENKEVNDLQKRLLELEIIEGDGLQQEISFGDNDKLISDKAYASGGSKTNCLYFKMNCNNKQKAEGIGEFLFENSTIKESIELILFYKEVDDLMKEFDRDEIELIQKKWKKDYASKFESFQNEIKSHYAEADSIDVKWFIYNSIHRSNFLISLDKKGKLVELKNLIQNIK